MSYWQIGRILLNSLKSRSEQDSKSPLKRNNFPEYYHAILPRNGGNPACKNSTFNLHVFPDEVFARVGVSPSLKRKEEIIEENSHSIADSNHLKR